MTTSMPASPPPAATRAASTTIGMGDIETTNILIVDDLPEKLLVYRSILEELGQTLVCVDSGGAALKQVLQTDFAVILLDVNMPGMDGFETAHLIRRRKRSAHTPIIFLTAFADEVQTTQGYATGGVDYIPTPVVPEILRAKVRVFVELFQMRQQVARQAEERARRTAIEEAARRSAFLAEASRVLTHSLDFEATLRGLLRLVVPALADVALVTRTAGASRGDISEMVWHDRPSGRTEHRVLSDAETPRDVLWECHNRVLATGKPELVERLNLPLPGMSEERVHSALVVPLTARGRHLGLLSLSLASPDRKFGLSDRELACDLAERAGIALDNARLYHDIQENDRRKNEFLAMLSHELRNPLAPVRNAVHVLRQGGLDEARVTWAREVIDRQVTHLVRLVDDLLDVSRITRGKIRLQPEVLRAADAVAVAVEASRPLIDKSRQQLTVSLPDQEVLIHGDPSRIAQVLSNLLNNAAKYTPEGGRIWLTVEQEKAEALFRVRDDGTGIPPEMLAKVFDLFTQIDHSLERSQGGLGVGLTLVRRLVEMHGGSVHAFSAGVGKGSEFVVRLPVAGAVEVGETGELETIGGPLPAAKRVLVVDDNVDAAESLATILRADGHEVKVGHRGDVALEISPTFRPDYVLLDIGLPGLDGYEVGRRLRGGELDPQPVLIAVSGYGQDEDRKRSHSAGFDAHLTKPISLETLRQLIAAGARRME